MKIKISWGYGFILNRFLEIVEKYIIGVKSWPMYNYSPDGSDRVGYEYSLNVLFINISWKRLDKS